MNADDREELNALVVGFLTSALKDNPSGFELRHFERVFPVQTEEPVDWYKRYGMPNALEALKNLGESVRVNIDRGGGIFISLNTRSNKVDQHLVDLVVNQRSSGKRKRPPARSQTQRVLDSFAINRRSSNYNSNYSSSNSHYRSRLNHDNSYSRSQNQFVEKSVGPLSAPRPTIYKDTRSAAPGDPRARQTSSQVRPTPLSQPFASSGPLPTKQTSFGNSASPIAQQPVRRPPSLATFSPSVASDTHSSKPAPIAKQSNVPAALQARETTTTRTASSSGTRIDPELDGRRLKVKQRLLYLLNHKLPQIKVLYLPHLYQKEYEEPLDPKPLGFKTLTELYLSFSDAIKISYSSCVPVVSAVVGELRGKENIASREGNSKQSTTTTNYNDSGNASSDPNASTCDTLENKENSMPSARARYNAIDPFNVNTMLQSLEPLKNLSEPPLGNNKLEDIVKYRTMRIIFKDPGMSLKLEEWERRYQQEWNCSNRIRIRDYGYKSLLEFFKSLSRDIPIRITLVGDEWIASSDLDTLSRWLQRVVSEGRYKAVTVIDAKYEHIAFPGDKYSYLDFEGLQQQPYYSSIKMAVTSAYKICLQMGSQGRAEDNITFETCSSCYDDYKRKDFFAIPEGLCKSGFPCTAFDESEQRWCRAIVVSAPDDVFLSTNKSISAFLVDYAVTKKFILKDLRCILKNHLKYPVSQLQPIIN